MRLCKIRIENFRGIKEARELSMDGFNVLVGRNDAGKSTFLHALDLFLNETKPTADVANVDTGSTDIAITCWFNAENTQVVIDEAIPTTFEQEELVDEDGLLCVTKTWNVAAGTPKAKVSLRRKTYGDADFVTLTEAQLISKCNDAGIETQKANGDEYNNVEKRQALREWCATNVVAIEFIDEPLPATGSGRKKVISDAIKKGLPSFEFFHADTSLSETDTATQGYFKKLATKAIENSGTDEMEEAVKAMLGGTLDSMAEKINAILAADEKVEPVIDFNWSQLVKTSFSTGADDANVPLRLRGDGYRRIVMMAYFEHLAETEAPPECPAIYGFEEPETFLHPSAQESLYQKIQDMYEGGRQVVVSTHSPVIVANTPRTAITHVYKTEGAVSVTQSPEDLNSIAEDLGITVDNQFVAMFDSAKALLLVEGVDDVDALTHVASVYNDGGVVDGTFESKDIALVPLGGKDNINHWMRLDLLTKLSKPFYVFLDSDREAAEDEPGKRAVLVDLGLSEGEDFHLTRKREMENYLCPNKLNELVPDAAIAFGDHDDVKAISKQSSKAVELGGKLILRKHIASMPLENLKARFCSEEGEDEFVMLFNNVVAKLPVT